MSWDSGKPPRRVQGRHKSACHNTAYAPSDRNLAVSWFDVDRASQGGGLHAGKGVYLIMIA